MSQELTPVPPAPSVWAPSDLPAWSDATRDSVDQLLHVLFKRKLLVFGLFLAFFLSAAIAAYLEPPVASAVAKILLKPDRVSLRISDLAPQGRQADYSLQALQSEVELIKSRDVLRPVAEAVITSERRKSSSKRDVDKEADPIADWKPPSRRDIDRRADSIANRVSAVALPETSVIQVKYSDSSAKKAESILGLIVNQYIAHHTRAYSGSVELVGFYEHEKERARVALENAEDALREWQQANRVISIDEQIKGLLALLSNQERQSKEADATVQVAPQQDPLLARLRQDLSAAEIALNEIRQRYMDTDRRVQEKQEQIQLIQLQIDSAHKALVASRGAQRRTLDRQIAETQATLEVMRGKKVEGERLSRAVDLARDAFLLYGKKLEETRIAAKLDEQQLSNLTIIEAPRIAETSVERLERASVLPLGSVVGLVIGVFVALGLELFNRSLRTRRDVEIHLQLPVLASIPLLRSPTS
jgi:uncharacterized protein involved in exopolysaccharide biosynthesis